LAVLVAPRLGAAQVAKDPRNAWTDHRYPAFWYTSIDGFWFAGHYDWSSAIGFAERPEPTYARIALDAGASTAGSYSVILDAQAPAYWEGWRVGLPVDGARAERAGRTALRNSTTIDTYGTTG